MPRRSVQIEFLRSPTNVSVIVPNAQPVVPVQPEPKPAPPPPVAPPPAPVDNSKQIQEQLDYLQNLLNDVGRTVEDLKEQHRSTAHELHETAVELAVVAASWLTRVAIDADNFAVDDLVRDMIARLHDEQPVRIRLNRDDANLLMSLKESSADTPEFSNADVEFIPDDTLQRGVIRAESDRTTLITDLDGRLDDIRQTWMENLNETQTERRADESNGRELRRFPDRRHTA